MTERDPNGKGQHEPGAKVDSGKNRVGLVFSGFCNALPKVAEIGTFGASKYTDYGFLEVPRGVDRYQDAMFRHYFKWTQGEELDPDSNLSHLGHMAWNALAILELVLREKANDSSRTGSDCRSGERGSCQHCDGFVSADELMELSPKEGSEERKDSTEVPRPSTVYGLERRRSF